MAKKSETIAVKAALIAAVMTGGLYLLLQSIGLPWWVWAVVFLLGLGAANSQMLKDEAAKKIVDGGGSHP